ncbi:ribonuclease H, partial [Trifolium pratense]
RLLKHLYHILTQVAPADFIALSCDWAVTSQTGLAGCGGVLRNCHGGFLVAFFAKVGSVSVVRAELWGIIHGLNLAKNKWHKRVRVEYDSLVAINLMKTV